MFDALFRFNGFVLFFLIGSHKQEQSRSSHSQSKDSHTRQSDKVYNFSNLLFDNLFSLFFIIWYS